MIPAVYTSLDRGLAGLRHIGDRPSFLAIGRQIHTRPRGRGGPAVYGWGREIRQSSSSGDTSQAWEHLSLVKDLEFDKRRGIADSCPGITVTLETAFRELFGMEFPEQLR